jgi:hypothetical protein
MARMRRTVSSTKGQKPAITSRTAIPEPFQLVSSVSTITESTRVEVPMLVLYGDWLKAVGFPIGSAAVLTTDRHGELALHRLGLELPRRVYIRAMPD